MHATVRDALNSPLARGLLKRELLAVPSAVNTAAISTANTFIFLAVGQGNRMPKCTFTAVLYSASRGPFTHAHADVWVCIIIIIIS